MTPDEESSFRYGFVSLFRMCSMVARGFDLARRGFFFGFEISTSVIAVRNRLGVERLTTHKSKPLFERLQAAT
jgi:hypothetical protein